MRNTNILINIATLIAVVFSFITADIWLLMLLNGSFNTFISTSFVPIIFASIFLVYYFRNSSSKFVISSNTYPFFKNQSFNKPLTIAGILSLLTSLALVALGIDELFLLPWLFFACCLICLYLGLKPSEYSGSCSVTNTITSPKEIIALCCLGIFLVICYLFSIKNNADDTHFVSYIVSLLQHSNAEMFSVDTIFNQGKDNLIFALNYGQSWEALAGLLSVLLGVDHLTIYYLYLPCLFLFISPVPLFYFTKIYYPKHAFISVVFAFTILIAWSSYNHLHGSFFIPRFYQGKAILLTFLLPMLFLYARQFYVNPQLKSGLICTLLLIACGGTSSTGLYMSIIALGLCYLAYTPIRVKNIIKTSLLSLLIILPNLLMLGVVKANLNELESKQRELKIELRKHVNVTQLPPTPVIKEKIREAHSMYWLFGDNRYLAVFMFMFLTTFILTTLLPNVRSNELRRLYLVLGLLAFSHPLASALAKYLGPENLVWRFHWVLPMSIIFSLFSASILSIRAELIQSTLPPILKQFIPLNAVRLMTYGSIFCLAIIFLTLSAGHLSKSYSTEISKHKVNKEAYSVSRYIVENENKNDVILAAKLVAQILPMLERHSELVTSRPLYWKFPYFSADDLIKRKRLQYLIDNIEEISSSDITFLANEINDRKITMLVFKQKGQGNTSALLTERLYTQEGVSFTCESSLSPWMVCTN